MAASPEQAGRVPQPSEGELIAPSPVEMIPVTSHNLSLVFGMGRAEAISRRLSGLRIAKLGFNPGHTNFDYDGVAVHSPNPVINLVVGGVRHPESNRLASMPEEYVPVAERVLSGIDHIWGRGGTSFGVFT